MERRRPPRTFHVDRVLRPFHPSEARAQSLLSLCKLLRQGASSTAAAGSASPPPEFYVDHFVIDWTTRHRTAGAPLLLLVTSARVVLGDQARLRPLWEVPFERVARVELKPDHVLLWTWEKVGVGLGSEQNAFAYNIIVERTILCNNAATLEAVYKRLSGVARQRLPEPGTAPTTAVAVG